MSEAERKPLFGRYTGGRSIEAVTREAEFRAFMTEQKEGGISVLDSLRAWNQYSKKHPYVPPQAHHSLHLGAPTQL